MDKLTMATKSKKTEEQVFIANADHKKNAIDIREKQLFNALDSQGKGIILKSDLLEHLCQSGLELKDPRLKEFYALIESVPDELDITIFSKAIRPNILLIERALQGQLVIPDFQGFANVPNKLFYY